MKSMGLFFSGLQLDMDNSRLDLNFRSSSTTTRDQRYVHFQMNACLAWGFFFRMERKNAKLFYSDKCTNGFSTSIFDYLLQSLG